MVKHKTETEEAFKKRVKEYNYFYGIANRDKILARKKNINSTPEGKAKRKLLDSKYYASEIGREKRKLHNQAYFSKNREKICAGRKAYYMNNPQRKRDMANNTLKHNYGITLQDYELILVNQGGKCACCGKTPEIQKYRLAVDHNHKTGKIRGLLCRNCNVSLGLVKENKDTLLNMIAYLEKYNMGVK